MSMDIHNTKKDDIVIFDKPNAGNEGDIRTAAEYLIKDRIYKVYRVVVHSCHTDVFIKGMNRAFNSCMFSNTKIVDSIDVMRLTIEDNAFGMWDCTKPAGVGYEESAELFAIDYLDKFPGFETHWNAEELAIALRDRL